MTMMEVAGTTDEPVVIRRISEQVQSDPAVMLKLKQVGIQPGREVRLAVADDGVRVIGDHETDNTSRGSPTRRCRACFCRKALTAGGALG